MRLQVTPEEHAAEATRKAAVSFIIKRLQVLRTHDMGVLEVSEEVFRWGEVLPSMASHFSAGKEACTRTL